MIVFWFRVNAGIVVGIGFIKQKAFVLVLLFMFTCRVTVSSGLWPWLLLPVAYILRV